MMRGVRKGIVVALVCALLVVTTVGCGNTMVVKNVEYDTYGLLNEDEKKNPEIEYRVIWGNVFWGIVLSETIIAPIYFFGYSLFEPVGEKPEIKGQVVR